MNMGIFFVKYRINGRRINNLRTEVAQFHRFDKRQPLDDISRIDYPGVSCHEAIDIGPDFELRGIESGSQDSCRIIRSPRPRLVTSPLLLSEAMNPGTTAIRGNGLKPAFTNRLVSSKSTMCLPHCICVLMNRRES